MTGVEDKGELCRKVFHYLSGVAFTQVNPELVGMTFDIIRKQIGNDDPYLAKRTHFNELFLSLSEEFERRILAADDPFALAVRYAIVGNVIDFNPVHNTALDDMMAQFETVEALAIDDVEALRADVMAARSLLYLGDNCGEICLDKLLLRQIRKLNPELKLFFGVRGRPVINDSIEADAYAVGIDEVATVISNGDGSPGTVLSRVSPSFRRVYDTADVVIAKGQGNYESLWDADGQNRYFLLMAKCAVISGLVGAPIGSRVCLHCP